MNHRLINQDSGSKEWYTPPEIIEAARCTMGSIDLDPATTRRVNDKVVKARTIFTARENGLKREWYGNVWLNPPFGRRIINVWVRKACLEMYRPGVTSMCVLTYSSTGTTWFNMMMGSMVAVCILSWRTNFLNADLEPTSGATKSCVVFYHGPDIDRFGESFSGLGTILIALGDAKQMRWQ